jgi:hypothetical protein
VIARAAALAALSLTLAAPARGQDEEDPGKVKFGSFELGLGSYRPNIDSEFATKPGPYEKAFGTGRGLLFRLGFGKAVARSWGTLELGFRTGFYRDSGHGFLSNDINTQSADSTTFNIIPTSLTFGYRADFLALRHGIPLVPYGRVALERYNWWVTGGKGNTSQTGATNGYSGALGIALDLSLLDPGLGHELERETGIKATYLFFDATKSKIDDFGSKKSWDLSDSGVSLAGGLLFVF